MTPLVSIMIPCFNAAPWVGAAIESALVQTWPNKEVIVLNDGSTDGSLEVIRRYEGRIQVATQPNGGQNVSRNHLTRLSKGEWLVYLDADDELMPDSVEKKLKAAVSAAAVYGSIDYATFKDGKRVKSEKLTAEDYADPLVAAFGWKYPNTTAFMFQRQALLAAGGWDETVKNCTDYALYFPLLLKGGRFNAAPDAWSLYRQWSTTQAANEAPMRRMRTRLKVMEKAALDLGSSQTFTAERKQAFMDSSLQVIRTIYPHDESLARQEHRRLLSWNSSYVPAAKAFPRNYLRVYRLLGFAAAERVASWLRSSHPTVVRNEDSFCLS